jgi:hypothetical protein
MSEQVWYCPECNELFVWFEEMARPWAVHFSYLGRYEPHKVYFVGEL